MVHGGGAPSFIMRAVSFHKTALSRQVAEAVRIRRRGGEGAILNSKAEYNRCHIPRLQLEELEPEGARKECEQEMLREVEEHDSLVITNWEKTRTQMKAKEQRQYLERSRGAKNGREQLETDDRERGGGRKKRKLEHPIIGEEWGSSAIVETGREQGATLQSKEVPKIEGEQPELAGSPDDVVGPVMSNLTGMFDESNHDSTDHTDDQASQGERQQGEDIKASNDNSSHHHNLGQMRRTITTPPIDEKCEIGKDSICRTHGIKASSIYVSSKKWSRKSDNSFGWKYQKVKKTICKFRSIENKENSVDQTTPTFSNIQGVGAGFEVEKTFRTPEDDGISDVTGNMHEGLANGD